ALRERMDDIPLLSRHFLKRFNKKFEKQIKGITRKAQILLMNYPWPGNVRELENILERAVLMAQEDFITLKDLPQYLFSEQALKDTGSPSREMLTLEDVEKAHIKRVFEKHMNNKFQTAKDLGISRSTLYKKLERYDLL
ncbi:MAG: helix-turn-helix domain-containing protein, partial [Vicinamibacteria bacterium]